MKNIFTLLLSLVIYSTMTAQTFCLEMSSLNPTQDGSQLYVELFVSGSSAFEIGLSNLRFTFDQTKVENPQLVSSPLDFPTGYFPPTVTNPGEGEASFNTEQTTGGFEILTEPTSIGIISFDILDDQALTDFSWLYNGGTTLTQIYTDDFVQIFATGDDNSCLVPLQNAALPIKMKSFTAAPFQNRDANLNWTTASEVNASHFEVERSDDGINFTQIGIVNATGNSTTNQVYQLSDRDVNMKRSVDAVKYYRIKMVDIDAEYKYSGIRTVNFTRELIDFEISMYPNPTTDYLQFTLEGIDQDSEERPVLHMYDTNGSLVLQKVLDSDLDRLDLTHLPSRIYHINILYKGLKYNKQIVKIN